MAIQEKYLKPDSKGRILLGKRAKGISSYKIIEEKDGCIVLIPQVEIPAREAWLYQNREALEAVKKGLEDSASGKVRSRGSFAQYINDEIE